MRSLQLTPEGIYKRFRGINEEWKLNLETAETDVQSRD
jgi:hypothetical protein